MTVLEELELIEEQARFKGNEVHKNLAPGATHEEIDRCQNALDFLLPMSLERSLLESNGFSVVVENAELD